jgi:uncharacterized protein YjbJ (UPF0337 family)
MTGTTDKIKGRKKEAVGVLTGNRRLKGRMDQTTGKLKKTRGKVKKTVARVTDMAKE